MFDKEMRDGLISVAVFGALSFVSAFAFALYIAYRLINWRGPSHGNFYENQFVILVLNLLIADGLQASAFTLSLLWLARNGIDPKSDACFVQAWFFQIGDTSNALFIIAIALHTFATISKGYQLPFKGFVSVVLFIWGVAVFFSFIGPLAYGRDMYTSVGVWV